MKKKQFIEGKIVEVDMPLDEIKKLIAERMITGAFPCENDLEVYLPQVLSRIPEKDLEYLLFELDIVIMQFAANTVIKFETPEEVIGKTFVAFQSNLTELSKSKRTYIIAHEFAHVFLGHDHGMIERVPEAEIEADNLVIKWGFEKELRESGLSYLEGSNKFITTPGIF